MRQSMKEILMTRSSDGMIQSHHEVMRVGGRLSDMEVGQFDLVSPNQVRRLPHKTIR
ncbi:hypothetical protein [Paenibacillus sp. KN14-4R]|uniref:hypothetical protein n=1 Tax=Paenibacillus sp. KN14-4R TaxID=3445773 RepID=UPI003F9FF2C7